MVNYLLAARQQNLDIPKTYKRVALGAGVVILANTIWQEPSKIDVLAHEFNPNLMTSSVIGFNKFFYRLCVISFSLEGIRTALDVRNRLDNSRTMKAYAGIALGIAESNLARMVLKTCNSYVNNMNLDPEVKFIFKPVYCMAVLLLSRKNFHVVSSKEKYLDEINDKIRSTQRGIENIFNLVFYPSIPRIERFLKNPADILVGILIIGSTLLFLNDESRSVGLSMLCFAALIL